MAHVQKLLRANTRKDGSPKRGCAERVATLRAELEQIVSSEAGQ